MKIKKPTPTSYLLDYLFLLAQQITPPTTYICWANKSHYLFPSTPFPLYICLRISSPCLLFAAAKDPRSALPSVFPSLPGGPPRQRLTPDRTPRRCPTIVEAPTMRRRPCYAPSVVANISACDLPRRLCASSSAPDLIYPARPPHAVLCVGRASLPPRHGRVHL